MVERAKTHTHMHACTHMHTSEDKQSYITDVVCVQEAVIFKTNISISRPFLSIANNQGAKRDDE